MRFGDLSELARRRCGHRHSHHTLDPLTPTPESNSPEVQAGTVTVEGGRGFGVVAVHLETVDLAVLAAIVPLTQDGRVKIKETRTDVAKGGALVPQFDIQNPELPLKDTKRQTLRLT